MHFFRKDGFLAASIITGPKHNLLLMRLAGDSGAAVQAERLAAVAQCNHSLLDESALILAMQDGIAQGNAEFGTNYSVSHIQYVENDTKPEAVYAFLAFSIVRHLAQGGQFHQSDADGNRD